jgi:DNA-binding response OmpR family regulator
MRRPPEVLAPVIQVGNTSINPATLELMCNGVPVELRFSERRLLLRLMRRPGSLLQKGALESSLSELGKDLSSNAVEALVSRTRKALGDAGSDVIIETVRGMGYTLKGKSK